MIYSINEGKNKKIFSPSNYLFIETGSFTKKELIEKVCHFTRFLKIKQEGEDETALLSAISIYSFLDSKCIYEEDVAFLSDWRDE